MTGAHPASPTLYAEALLLNLPDQMLLVRHVGDGGWSLPGTWVQSGESPQEAARRAVREQVGLDVAVGRLLAVEWRDEPDEVHFLFDGGIPEPVVYDELAPDARLVSEWRYALSAEAVPLLAKPELVRYVAALAVQEEPAPDGKKERTAYLENGRVLPAGNTEERGADS